MNANINWCTKYYVTIENYEICAVYYNNRQPSPWEVYIQTNSENALIPLINAFRASGIKFGLEGLKLYFILGDSDIDTTFIGGSLPPKYEKLLDQIEKVVYEITRETEEN